MSISRAVHALATREPSEAVQRGMGDSHILGMLVAFWHQQQITSALAAGTRLRVEVLLPTNKELRSFRLTGYWANVTADRPMSAAGVRVLGQMRWLQILHASAIFGAGESGCRGSIRDSTGPLRFVAAGAWMTLGE